MQAKNRLLDVALLAAALVGPLFHLLGMLARGTALLNVDYSRLTLTYVMLGLSAAAGALVVVRNTGMLRLVAGVAVLANLASIAYAAHLWSRDMRQALLQAEMSPTQPGKVGILVAATGYTDSAEAEARDLEKTLLAALQRVDLDTVVSLQQVAPVSSEDQARRQGRQYGARMVVWQTLDSGGVATYSVTILGANETPIELEPLTLMLLMATQDTYSVSRTFAENGREVPVLTRSVVPVAAGFVALAVGQPVLAAAQFQAVQQLEGLPPAALLAAHDYRGIALLFAQRPDLAIAEYEALQALSPNARGWVGIGNVMLARREWQAAARAYQQALALDVYNPEGYCGLGVVHAAQRDVSRAITAYNQAIALAPECAAPYALLGKAYELVAEVDSAKRAYETCASLSGAQAGLYVAARDRAVSVVQNPPTPVPTATPLPTSTPAPTPILPLYTVQRGDTLASIAEELGVSVQALAELNDLDNPDSISIGQQLLIPQEE